MMPFLFTTIAKTSPLRAPLRRSSPRKPFGFGPAEYYLELDGGGDPGLPKPDKVFINDVDSTEGTMGSLAQGEWDYGDNDTLGYSTIYVRLSDDSDPDTDSPLR